MLADGDVAQVLRDLDRHDFVARRRLGVAEIGRTEQAHRAAGQRLEQPLRGVESPACRASGVSARLGWVKV